ncbi:hypothetical protein GCM10028803_40620 [Larkinella knui]
MGQKERGKKPPKSAEQKGFRKIKSGVIKAGAQKILGNNECNNDYTTHQHTAAHVSIDRIKF